MVICIAGMLELEKIIAKSVVRSFSWSLGVAVAFLFCPSKCSNMTPRGQAMMCGCPAVMPYCSVFDEIWTDKTPKARKVFMGF